MPVSRQNDFYHGLLEAKPATARSTARRNPRRRGGVQDGGTRRQHIKLTGETLFGPAEKTPCGREAYKGRTRKRSNEAGQGIGGGHSTDELRENRREGRTATFIKRTKQGKAAGVTLLYDKVCGQDILREAWQRVKS